MQIQQYSSLLCAQYVDYLFHLICCAVIGQHQMEYLASESGSEYLAELLIYSGVVLAVIEALKLLFGLIAV